MTLPSFIVAWVIWRYLPEPERGGYGSDGQDFASAGEQQLPRKASASARRRQSHPASTPTPAAAEAAHIRQIIRRSGTQPREELILRESPNRWNLWRAIRYLLRIPTYDLLMVASSLAYYFFAGVRSFGMIYLTHHYGIARSTVSALIFVVGIGAIVGLAVGAKLSGWALGKGQLSGRIVVPGLALLLSALLIGPAVWIANVAIGIVLLTFGAGALAAANPPIDAARLDVVPAGLRGRGEAGRMALRGGLQGGAPLLFGAISDLLGGGTAGLKWTFLIMLLPVFIAASLAIPARHTYPRDMATAEASARAIEEAEKQGKEPRRAAMA